MQAGYAPPGGPFEPSPTRRWPRWLLVAVVAWAVLLAVLTGFSVRDDEPTVREQRTLAQAGPVVDRAIGELVAAAGDDTIVELTPARVERGCRVTLFMDGATLERGIVLHTAGDGMRPLLDRIVERLPGSYRAGVRVTGDGLRLRADAGEFVKIGGGPIGDGLIRLTAGTGCRPVGSGYAVPSATLGGPEAEAVADVLRALGRRAESDPEPLTASCPDGDRSSRTVRASAGPGPRPASLAAALAPVAAGVVLVDTTEVYAYRRGSLGVVVDATGDQLRVSASTGCAS